jgi:hypothetical protein
VEQAFTRPTDPARRRALYRREKVARGALDYLKATGMWGTWTGAASALKRARRHAQWGLKDAV